MCKKTVFYCLVSLLAITFLSTQSYAAIDVNSMAMTVGWPAVFGTPQIKTCDDPNELPTFNQDPSFAIRNAENFIAGRGVSQIFTVAEVNEPFSLRKIVIRAGGGGDNTIGPYTVHLYDIDDPEMTSLWGSYTPATQSHYPGVDFLSDTTGFLGNTVLMQYASGDADELVWFDFSADDIVDLEPGHLYAFEIWGSENCVNYPFLWIRYQAKNPYINEGDGYECPASRDSGQGAGPKNLYNYRSQLSGLANDTVMAVYGVPYDGNAFHPTPRNYETGVNLNPTLSWQPGKWVDDTLGHQVWFSTSFNAVARRLASANKGRRTEPNYTPPGPLALNTTYYWRVDEYNDCGACTPQPPCHLGTYEPADVNCYWGVESQPGVDKTTIYRFTTLTPQAHNPTPAPGSLAELNIKSLQLSWLPGALVGETNGHRVYFGTNLDDVNNADTGTPKIYRGAMNDPCYPLMNLLEDKNGDSQPDYTLTTQSYYWRVDEVNDTTVWKGDVWSFTMPPYVVVDNFTYSGDTALQAVWKTGQKKETCAPVLECVPGGAITVSTGAMRMDYDNTGSMYCGWSEAKMDNGDLGLDMDWTAGGLVDLQSLSIGIDGNIFSGSDLVYDNMYVAVEDAAGNIATVYNSDHYIQKRQFNGASASGVWYIKLDDLNNGTPGEVDLTDINAVYIGLGPRCVSGGGPSSTGTIFFDNIRLNMPRCLADYQGYKSSQTGDFAGVYNGVGNWTVGDCKVNLYDLDYLADVWTDGDVTVSFTGVVPPLNDSGHLMARYEFDETSGSIAYDSSGNGKDATVCNPNPLVWNSSKISGTGCINLEAGFRTWLEVPTSAYRPDTNGVTFSFWSAYDMNYQPWDSFAASWSSVFTLHDEAPPTNGNDTSPGSQLIESQIPTPWPPNHDYGPQARFVDTRGGVNVGRPGVQWAKFSDYGLRWNHYAFTYDDINKIKTIYENGQLIGSAQGDGNVLPIWPAAGSFRIGTRSNRTYNPSVGYMGANWGFWFGKLDDFRVYNYALTDKEIQYIATKGMGSRTIQLMDMANLNTAGSPQRINFADYAILINNWLKEDMWP